MSIMYGYSHGKKHASSMTSRGRKSKKLENISKQKKKYPLLAEMIVKMSDIILEVLDSRAIEETRNPEIEELIKKENKKIIYVFNKADLIDYKTISGKTVKLNPKVFVSCVKRSGIKELRDKIKIISTQIKEFSDTRFDRVTVGVVGYPNTGKSSVINILIGKKVAGTAPEAGYTKGIQKAKLTTGIVLLDSPGIIPNKEYSTSDSRLMSQQTKLGARSYNQTKDPETVVSAIVKEYPAVFDKFYNIISKGDAEVLIEKLGRQKGFLKKGNEVNEDRTARFILRDWQEGKIRRG
ncbi:MAG: GTPase [Nanoarchaeota archaeon]